MGFTGTKVAEVDRTHRASEQPEDTSQAEADATEDPKPGTDVVEVKLFDFEGKGVRIQDRDGNPWFVLNDVCEVLEIANPRDAAGRLDDDETDAVGIADAMGRIQETNVVNESGVNALIMTSRKPEAKRFRKWVTGTVIPSIRKHGAYKQIAQLAGNDLHAAREQLLKQEEEAQRRALEAAQQQREREMTS
jgi:prophage antirepressor-like protein